MHERPGARLHGLLLAVLFLSVALGGCILDRAEPAPRDPRYHGYEPEELEGDFTRTTDLVMGLDGLAEDGYVVLEIVPEVNADDLRHQVWFIHPTDQPSPERRLNYCAEYKTTSVTWGAASTRGALAVQHDAAVDVSYETPSPTRIDGVSHDVASAAYRPYFVLFGVDDAARWEAAGADARLHVQGGAVWWRVVAEGSLTCAFEASDYDDGTFTQSLLVNEVKEVSRSVEASGHALLELLWLADRSHVQVDHNGTALLEESGAGGGGRLVSGLEAGTYTIQYRDVQRVGGPAYAGFVMRDVDLTLMPVARHPYWATTFQDDRLPFVG